MNMIRVISTGRLRLSGLREIVGRIGRWMAMLPGSGGGSASPEGDAPTGVTVPDAGPVIARVDESGGHALFARKQPAAPRPKIDPGLSQLILWHLVAATGWLLVGTTVGEYLGIKFMRPDVDHVSWLGFGRLRPVHTNTVFWGWASIAMVGLGYYVVAMVSNARFASVRRGWLGFALLNLAVLLGDVSLLLGINNGGGEYREFTWPVMALFGGGLFVALTNFIGTMARRREPEIYVSNWYMTAALMFILVVVTVGYLPVGQQGLGETIIQGYYMHQAVGMWFMMFLLGLCYYFVPQQLNTPIYSYSLGVLAFWTQIICYTLIGTHHFVFSSIPWWLQTVAIIGSAGMLVPVAAGAANFLLTFRGHLRKVAASYSLPFFLTGVICYVAGSAQGVAEAFRSANLLWHFTDFTVAHSHLTMYGIITFLLWGCIYAVVPRLTGREPSQAAVGVHFWGALLGLAFYSVPLMIGGTMRGLAWMEGRPFIDSVTLMAPYWLWRAIGGTMMWASHWVFACNLYRMIGRREDARRGPAFPPLQ